MKTSSVLGYRVAFSAKHDPREKMRRRSLIDLAYCLDKQPSEIKKMTLWELLKPEHAERARQNAAKSRHAPHKTMERTVQGAITLGRLAEMCRNTEMDLKTPVMDALSKLRDYEAANAIITQAVCDALRAEAEQN